MKIPATLAEIQVTPGELALSLAVEPLGPFESKASRRSAYRRGKRELAYVMLAARVVALEVALAALLKHHDKHGCRDMDEVIAVNCARELLAK